MIHQLLFVFLFIYLCPSCAQVTKTYNFNLQYLDFCACLKTGKDGLQTKWLYFTATGLENNRGSIQALGDSLLIQVNKRKELHFDDSLKIVVLQQDSLTNYLRLQLFVGDCSTLRFSIRRFIFQGNTDKIAMIEQFDAYGQCILDKGAKQILIEDILPPP